MLEAGTSAPSGWRRIGSFTQEIDLDNRRSRKVTIDVYRKQ